MIIIGGFRGAWGACARPHMGKFFHFHAIFKQKSVNTVKHAPLLGSRPLIWKILGSATDYASVCELLFRCNKVTSDAPDVKDVRLV